MVSSTSIACMAIVAILSVVIAVGLCAFVKVKYKTSVKVAVFGALGFFVFAGILETMMHQIVLSTQTGVKIYNNIWLYALYGGLAAGVFEETSRFLIIKFLLKKEQSNPRNAIMYGAGHGGFEAAFLMVTGMINNITYAIFINSNQTDILLSSLNADQKVQMKIIFNQLINIKPYELFTGYIERVPAVCIHIALSVIVWIAVTKKKTFLYPVAILLHALVDAIAVIAASFIQNAGLNVLWTEIFIYASATILCIIGYKVWKNNKTDEPLS